MKVEILQELRPYSFNELQEVFQQSDVSTQDILKSLSIANIIRKTNKDVQKQELEELLDIEEVEILESDAEIYVFKYVGMIIVENVCIIIYPKYLSDFLKEKDREYCDLRQILSVIKKYKHREQKIFGMSRSTSDFNLLSTALELIENYHENGLYRNDQQIIEINGNGEILWEKTINESQAYFSNNRPFYLDVFNVSQKDDTSDYFRRLHSAILTELSSKLHDVFKILNVEGLYLTSEKVRDFGSIEYIITNIDREMTTQFITSRQRVLKLLKRYLLEQESFHSNQRISLLGTSNFNLVWQDVCSVVQGNNLKTPLVELGLKSDKNKKKSALLSDAIEKPKWKSYKHNKEHLAKRTLIPDIVVVEGKHLAIYDAKYYKILLDDKKVDKQPGIEDVAKQYLYEMAFKELSLENNLDIKINAFLMPSDSDEWEQLGNVKMDIFHNLDFKEIEIILLPTRKVFAQYLNS